METVKRPAGQALDLGCFDAVVYGGGLSGWAAAVTLARQQRRVLLAADHTALGWEIWGALSVWVEDDSGSPLLGELLAGLKSSNAWRAGVLDPVAAEVVLDRLITEAGAKLLLQVHCHPSSDQELLVTGKWGLMAARAAVVIDATPAGRFAREAGATFTARATDELALRRAFMVRAALSAPAEFPVPMELPVAGSKVLARLGRWPGDVILQAALTLDTADPHHFETASRRALTNVGSHLRANEPAFAASSFVQVAHEPILPRAEVCQGCPGQPLVPQGVERVVLASACADFGDLSAEQWHTPAHAICIGETAAELAAEMIGG